MLYYVMLYHIIIARWKDTKHNDGLCGYRSNGASNGRTLAECNERAGERFQCSQHCGARVHIGKLLQSRFFKRVILRFHFVDDLVSPLCVSFRALWCILAYVLASGFAPLMTESSSFACVSRRLEHPGVFSCGFASLMIQSTYFMCLFAQFGTFWRMFSRFRVVAGMPNVFCVRFVVLRCLAHFKCKLIPT